jgi:hypothetical protein
MKAFTIATGEYAELARITAVCFEWSTGLAPTILTDVADPFEAKLQLPDGEQYVFLDADVMFRKRWVIPEVPLDTFAAAPLQMIERGLHAIGKRHELPKSMLSTGLFISSSAHAPVTARARELMRTPNESTAGDETWLNIALHEAQTPILVLPQDVNVQLVTSVYATALHFCGERGAKAKFAAVRYNLEHHAPDELREFLRDRGVGDFVRPSPRGRRALGADGRTPIPAPVGSANLAASRGNRIAKVVGAHGTFPPIGVIEPVDVPKLVSEDVDKQDGIAAAGLAVEDGAPLGVEDDGSQPGRPNPPLRSRENT